MPPTARRSGRNPVPPSTNPVTHGERGAGHRTQHGRDDRFDEQGGDHRAARDAVGAEHAELTGAVGDRAGGGHRHLHDTDQQHRDGDEDDRARRSRRRVPSDADCARIPSDIPNTMTTRKAPVAVVTTGSTISRDPTPRRQPTVGESLYVSVSARPPAGRRDVAAAAGAREPARRRSPSRAGTRRPSPAACSQAVGVAIPGITSATATPAPSTPTR